MQIGSSALNAAQRRGSHKTFWVLPVLQLLLLVSASAQQQQQQQDSLLQFAPAAPNVFAEVPSDSRSVNETFEQTTTTTTTTNGTTSSSNGSSSSSNGSSSSSNGSSSSSHAEASGSLRIPSAAAAPAAAAAAAGENVLELAQSLPGSAAAAAAAAGSATAAAAAGGDLGAYDSDALPSAAPRVYRARLFGSMFAYAYYFLDVLVGTPPQRESVILDTGSSLLAFPCSQCEQCGSHLDALYNPSLSSSGEWVDCRDTKKCFGVCAGRQRLGSPENSKRCGYTQTYSEGSSISGMYLSDVVAIGAADQRNPPIRYDFIGCHVRETSLFVTQKASGILGVSFPKGFRQPTLIDVMFQQGLVKDKMFSICISEDGGLLTVGGFEPGLVDYEAASRTSRVSPLPSFSLERSSSSSSSSRSDEPQGRTHAEGIFGASSSSTPEASSLITWTGLTSRAAYRVKLLEMEADGIVLGSGEADFGKTLVDSGTTYSYFPPAVFAAWRSVLLKFCTAALFCQKERDGRPCWRATSEKFLSAALPVLKLTFAEGSTITWHPHSYLYRRTGGFWCDGLDDNRMQESVLGLSFFKHKQIIFDRSRDRIGAINAKCPNFFLEERPKAPNEIDSSKVEKVSLIPEDYSGVGDGRPRKSPKLIGGNWDNTRDTAAFVFWMLLLLGASFVLVYSICRCCMGTSALSSPSPGDTTVESQQLTQEGRLAAWQDSRDTSDSVAMEDLSASPDNSKRSSPAMPVVVETDPARPHELSEASCAFQPKGRQPLAYAPLAKEELGDA